MFRILCTIALLLPAWMPAWGVTPFPHNFTVRLVVHRGNAPTATMEETDYWTGTQRISDNAHRRTITDFEKKTLTTIYKDSRTFSVQSFEAIGQQTEAQRRHLDSLPLDAQLKLNINPPAVEVSPTGKLEQLLGYQIREYALQGPLTGSVWVAESIEVAAAAQEFAQVMKQLGEPSSPGRQLAEGLAQIKGLPLKMTIITGAGPSKVVTATEAVEISQKAPPVEALDVPQGYVKTEIPKLSH